MLRKFDDFFLIDYFRTKQNRTETCSSMRSKKLMNSSFFSLSLSYLTNRSPFFCRSSHDGSSYMKTLFKNFQISKSISTFFYSKIKKSTNLSFYNSKFTKYLDIPIKIEESNLFNSYISNHLNLSDSEINIEQCIFQDIHTHDKGAPFYISNLSGSVNISFTTIVNCSADLGSGGGQILTNVCRIKSLCYSMCYTESSEKIQSLDLNCKNAEISNIQITKCSSEELPSIGVTVFQFKCSYYPMTIEYFNITRNYMAGNGYVLREIDTINCLTKYCNFYDNHDDGKGILIGESQTSANMMLYNHNIINNSVYTLLNIAASTAEPQEKQVYNCIFNDNNYTQFLKQQHSIQIIFENCVFDTAQELLNDQKFTNCIFNQKNYPTLEISNIKCIFMLYPQDKEEGMSTTIIVLICCASVILAIFLILFVVLYCYKKRHQKELSFTDQYFRIFVNE